jgi:hypothetical protein
MSSSSSPTSDLGKIARAPPPCPAQGESRQGPPEPSCSQADDAQRSVHTSHDRVHGNPSKRAINTRPLSIFASPFALSPKPRLEVAAAADGAFESATRARELSGPAVDKDRDGRGSRMPWRCGAMCAATIAKTCFARRRVARTHRGGAKALGEDATTRNGGTDPPARSSARALRPGRGTIFRRSQNDATPGGPTAHGQRRTRLACVRACPQTQPHVAA